MNITEQHLETATIDWFGELGWQYANGLDIAPDGEQPACRDTRLMLVNLEEKGGLL